MNQTLSKSTSTTTPTSTSIPATSLAAVLKSQGVLEIQSIPSPKLTNEHNVIIKVMSTTICGSDVHYYTHGHIGDFVVKSPMILGHECSGIVVSKGSNVTALELGDRVALEPGVPCRRCEYCTEGRYNLCRKLTFFATPPDDGSLVEYLEHDSFMCHKIPDSMSFSTASLLEPLSVGIHAAKRAKLHVGDKVIITGGGPVGLLVGLMAKCWGASIVDISEPNLFRRKFISSFDEISNVFEPTQVPIDYYDVAIDCTGIESAIQTSIHAIKHGGRMLFIGLGADYVKFPIAVSISKELDIYTIFRYRNTWPLAIQLAKKIPLEKFITHKFPLPKFQDALDTFLDPQIDSFKIEITFPEMVL